MEVISGHISGLESPMCSCVPLQASRKREAELEDLRHRTEEKVHEANKESLEISTSLSDAHEWFKSKFDTLQDELIKSR